MRARAGAQVSTQRSWKRPFGVGLLVAGYDKAGAKLFYCCPSGSYYDYKAMAIGARSQARCKLLTHQARACEERREGRVGCSRLASACAQVPGDAAVSAMAQHAANYVQAPRESHGDVQAAKTYLERKFEEFAGADLDTLIRHGLQVR